MEEKNAGWGKVQSAARKFCFFPKGEDESLCRKYTRMWGWGKLFGSKDFEDSNHDSSDNCAACKKIHAKRYGEGK